LFVVILGVFEKALIGGLEEFALGGFNRGVMDVGGLE